MISVAYFDVVLFRLHERDTATEKEFETALQMTLEDVLTSIFKQSNEWTEKVNYIRKYTLSKQPLLDS